MDAPCSIHDEADDRSREPALRAAGPRSFVGAGRGTAVGAGRGTAEAARMRKRRQ